MGELIWTDEPDLTEPAMIIGFTGWMNGGEVSTGTIEFLEETIEAQQLARIDPADFYVHNFPPGALPITLVSDGERTIVRSLTGMEQAAIFRPHTEIEDGFVRSLQFPANEFYYSQQPPMVLFSGEEPHIRWGSYADCFLDVARQYNGHEILFVGSVSSPIPHTREPRLRASVNREELKEARQHPDLEFTDYEGPASFVTYLMGRAADEDINMWTLVVEIPHYPFLEIQRYPASILKICTVLNDWLSLELSLSRLEKTASAVSRKLDSLMAENEEFADVVDRLEQVYDAEEASVDEDVLKRLIDEIDLDERRGE